MRIATLTIAFLLCALTHSTIVITNPLLTPFPNNSLPYFYSNFGTITYQKTNTYNLKILTHPLCQQKNSTTMNITLDGPTFVVLPWDQSGNCSYVQQSMIVQQLGARGVMFTSEWVEYEEGQVVLADDGNGRKVHIPVLFITDQTYATLATIKGSLQIKTNFPLPKSSISTLTFYISSSQRSSYLFLKKLHKDYPHLSSHINLQPIYHTFQGQLIPSTNCYYQYCAYDYDNMQQDVGQQIILEELHQYSVWQQEGQEKWLEYMNVYDQVCQYNWKNSRQCRQNVHQTTGIKNVELANAPISIMQGWQQRKEELAFDSFPEVAINNVIFRGNLQYPTFIKAVCDSLLLPPPFCQVKPLPQTPLPQRPPFTPIKAIALAMMSIVSVLIVAFCFYKRCITRQTTVEMTGRVNQLVAHYANRVNEQQNRRKTKLHEELNEQL